MLTAKFEDVNPDDVNPKDVNPDDNLEPKHHLVEHYSHPLPSTRAVLVCKQTASRQLKGSEQSEVTQTQQLPSTNLPLCAANQQSQQQQQQETHYPLIKLKRHYRDKENIECGLAEQLSLLEEEQERHKEPIRKRSVLEVVEEDIRKRLQQSTAANQKSRKRKHCLSLVAVDRSKALRSPIEEFIELSPPIFEEESENNLEVAEQCLEKSASQKSSVDNSKRLSQQIAWDQVEVWSEQEKEFTKEDPYDFDRLFLEKRDKSTPRTYAACSSSRLSLSKNFYLQQQHQLTQLLNENPILTELKTVVGEKRKLTPNNPKDPEQIETKCARLDLGGEDDMSIHHQQHFHLPCTSVSSAPSTGYHQETGTTSSILLLSAATEDSDNMSGHHYYTRSKTPALQSRFSLATATDMALAASLNEIPHSKVNSLQGRVDTGTATELAIAQSLSEDQQNLLNSNTSVIGSQVVTNLCTPPTPSSIAAAANMSNSLATLCNIGNSCYLNSVLYTLRFAPNFTHNLHHLIEDTDSVYQRLNQNKLKSSSLGRNMGLHCSSGSTLSCPVIGSNGTSSSGSAVASVRDDNLPPKSNRQVVTEQLHELFQNLNRNEELEAMEPYHAGNILRAVQDVSSTFEGNQQQDAHEFLMCVLDSIRESCQALIKTITDHPNVLINACPSVTECIETLVPESKSSGTRNFFRRRKESVKTNKQATANGAATLQKSSGNGGGCGGGGDGATLEQLSGHLKNPLFAKPSAALDEQHIRDRVQALGLDFFRDDFEGVTVSKTKCLACETCTEQKETMIDIAIPIASSEVGDAAKNPQLFYQNSCITREYFRGDNKYRCEVCCGYREAIRSISFEVLPRQLILQLKRFNGDMEKINSYIPTPFVLRCFCNTCLPKPDCDKPHIYRLYSVITHVGARMSVGHYIAYTSSLDVHAEYLGCGKDRRKQQLLAGGSIDGGGGNSVPSGSSGMVNMGTTGKSGNESKSTSGQLKKLFSSKKASSAGDMSKKIKNNVVNRLNLINGMEGLSLSNGLSTLGSSSAATCNSSSGNSATTSSTGGSLINRLPCAGLKCCGIHLKNNHLNFYGSSGSGLTQNSASVSSLILGCASETVSNGIPLDTVALVGCESNLGSNHSSKSTLPNPSMVAATINGITQAPVSTLTTVAAFEQSLNQQLWHMCDDDKIKIMSQTEFEELLSPNRRHVITPYLLFYTRYDLTQGTGIRSKDALAKHVPSSIDCNSVSSVIVEPADNVVEGGMVTVD